ncbi:MAG: Rrf2 family transcriptional regulator [SAR324 cluster bacterium]|nr:Rrf2 family transcriptional regulator [SAR324 cluster bacterium]
MLKLSKKIDYGLILLSRMCMEPAPESAREMAERYNLPQPMVANILKALSGAGMLASTRGVLGGYELARPAREISLAEIVEALEGPFSLVDCVADGDNCRFTSICPTHDPIQAVHHQFQNFMSRLSLAEIVGMPQEPFQFGTGSNENTNIYG